MNRRYKPDKAAAADEARKTRHLPTCSGVYRMTHRVTGDTYIGSSQNIRFRVRQHMLTIRTGTCVQKALRQCVWDHGFDFRVCVLERCDPADRRAAEQWWMDRLQPTLNKCRSCGSRYAK